MKNKTENKNFVLPKIPGIYDDDDDDVCTIHQENEPDDDYDWFPFLSYEDMVEYEIKRLMENENS